MSDRLTSGALLAATGQLLGRHLFAAVVTVLVLVAVASGADVIGTAASFAFVLLSLIVQGETTRRLLLSEGALRDHPRDWRFGPLFGLLLLVHGASLLAGGVAVLPGLFLIARWWLVTAILFDERLGVIATMRRSWQLTRGHWPALLMPILLLLLMQAGAGVAIWFTLDWTGWSAVGASVATNLLLCLPTVVGWHLAVASYLLIARPERQFAEVFA